MEKKYTREELEEWRDYDLAAWAVRNGWTYFNMNDQLRDPKGFLTTARNWEDITKYRRDQIINQMLTGRFE